MRIITQTSDYLFPILFPIDTPSLIRYCRRFSITSLKEFFAVHLLHRYHGLYLLPGPSDHYGPFHQRFPISFNGSLVQRIKIWFDGPPKPPQTSIPMDLPNYPHKFFFMFIINIVHQNSTKSSQSQYLEQIACLS